jgi:hypothetical protein
LFIIRSASYGILGVEYAVVPNKPCERGKYPQKNINGVFGRRLLVPLILLVLLADTSFMIGAEPAITVTSPADGARLLTHEVNVTGTASGEPQIWTQTSQSDFENGTMVNLTTNKDGDLFLDGGLYDDFSENYLDPERWYIANETGGMSSSVYNDSLQFSGTSNTTDRYGCRSLIYSTRTFRNSISAQCLWLCRTFNNYLHTVHTCIGISDNNSSFDIGFECNMDLFKINHTVYSISYSYEGGGFSRNFFELTSYLPTAFSICWNETYVTFNTDGIPIEDFHLYDSPIERPYVYFNSYVENEEDSLNATWDTVIGDPVHSGSFVSGVHDTGYSMPMLENVDWNEIASAGTALSVAVRSSDNPDMSNPTDWTTVSNNKTSGLPTIKRYIQYQVDFTSEDGIHSPVLYDIAISFDAKPVTKIELSLDNSTWLLANGTDKWYIELNLPEGSNTVWVKATHPAGDFDLTSITVDVDTTPPTGAIVINDNASYTDENAVILKFNASDRYSVSWMMLSEDPSFRGAAWQEYGRLAYFTLSTGDGLKTVYAKFKDSSGWESAVVNNSIVLDTTPPTASILPLPSVVDTTTFTVCWTGSDSLSGLLWFNVQYKDNDGNWTIWQILTNSTSAVFTGLDGHDYSFRIEAMDKAANVHPYPVTGTGPVRVRLPKPIVNILSPGGSSLVRSAINVEGTASHQNASVQIVNVSVSIDNGPWQSAAGTTAWKWKWDTTKFSNGPHTIRARAFDGQFYSTEATVNVTVNNPNGATLDAGSWPALAGIIILAVVSTGVYISLKRRRESS